MTDIASGLSAGLSKLLGKDAGEDLSAFAGLLDTNNLSSIKNNADAADLDLEEIIEIVFAIKDAWEDASPQERKSLWRVEQALMDALGLTHDDFNAIYNDGKDLDDNGRKKAFLNVAGSALALGTDHKEIAQNLTEKITSSEEEHKNDFTGDSKNLQGQKAQLRENADNPNALTSQFTGKKPDEIKLLLTSLATDMTEEVHDGFKKENFQAIFDAALKSLPEGEREKFLDELMDLINEKDGSDFVIDASAGDEIILAAFEYADSDKDNISHELRSNLYDMKKDINGASDEEGGSDDLDRFLKDHFGVYDDDEIFDDNGSLKSSQRSDLSGLVQEMVADDIVDSGSIISLMGKLPSGNARAQGELVQELLTQLPTESLEDIMPFLVGQILVLEQKGDIKEEEIDDIFSEVASSTNDADILEYMQEMGLDINSLKEGKVGEEMLANDSFREAIMDEWADLMNDESEEDTSLIDKQVSLVTGGDIESDDDSADKKNDDDKDTKKSEVSSAPFNNDLMQSLQNMGIFGMGGNMNMMGGMPMGMASMSMMNPMSAYTQGYTQGVTQSLMSGISGPGAFMGGGINITGDNNTVNINLGGAAMPAQSSPTAQTPTTAPAVKEESDK